MKNEIKIYPWDNDLSAYKNIEQKIIAGRKCIISNLSLEDCDDFLNKYHYQKSCKGQLYRYGLLYEDKLIGVMTFGIARFTKKVQYELLRLCFHPEYKVIGGSEKLFKYFIKEFKPNSIISYCDKSKFTGKVYETLGMKLVQKGLPKNHYWRDSDKKHITYKQLLTFGADKLIGTKYGKGINNEKILLSEGFSIIKDEGQDGYLYLDETQYFGYIYLTTDTINNKKYVGLHISSKFDPTYFGSGKIISEIIKKRKDTLKLEIIEWCKQDIGDREQYWINYYNTLFPNGYNLVTRKQWFDYNDSEKNSAILKEIYKGERGKELRKKQSEILKAFYNSSKGKELAHKISEKNKAFHKTPEGQRCIKKAIQKYTDFCYTAEGEKMRALRRKKQKEYNKTIEGKIKEEKRIQALKDFYNSEQGKKAKEQQIKKYKENLQTEEGKKKLIEKAKKYSEWAHTPEGQARLKEGVKKANETRIKHLTEQANNMSEEEWLKYLEIHPKTALKKYRK